MDSEVAGGCIVLVLVIAIVIGLSMAVDAFSCHSKWSRYDPSWGPFEGCQITWKGKRVPIEAARVMEE